MKFCENCGREIVWGTELETADRQAYEARAERRYIFPYKGLSWTQAVLAWAPHRCVPPKRDDEAQS